MPNSNNPKASKLGIVNTLRRFFAEQQKALVGDAGASVFSKGYAKPNPNLRLFKQRYDTDCSVGISIDTLAEMIAGSGYYLTINDQNDANQVAALEECNKLGERLHLDEKLLNIAKCGLIYGFVPVERVTRTGPPGGILGIKVLDPPTFTYKRDNITGEFEEFTQTVGGVFPKQIPFSPQELIWFTFNEVGNGQGVKYGVSAVSRIFQLLEIREQVVNNIQGIMKNQARPPVIWKVTNQNDVATLQQVLSNCRDQDQDPILYPAEGVTHEVVKVDTRSPYWEYVSYIDGLIFEGLHSPLLNYMRNATEASAKVMMESIDRHKEGMQRYIKRMIEHEIFEWHLIKKGFDIANCPVPSFNWGKPETALDDLETASFVTKGLEVGYITRHQYLDILKQIGLELPDDEPQEDPQSNQPQSNQGQITATTTPAKEPLNPRLITDSPTQPEETTYVITKSTAKPRAK